MPNLYIIRRQESMFTYSSIYISKKELKKLKQISKSFNIIYIHHPPTQTPCNFFLPGWGGYRWGES